MLPPTRQLKKLGEIIDLNYGKGIDKSERVQNIANPIYGANGVLSYTNKFIYDGESIIIGRKGSAGALTRVSGKFRPSDVTYYITTKVALNMDYLFYGLHILNIPSLAQGIKPGINRNDVYSLMFPLPPLPVQHTIVTALDQASASISASKSALQSQIDALDALWQSSLSEGMNNKIGTLTKLGTICDFVRGPFGGSLKKEIFKPDGYAIYEQQHAIYNQFSDIRYFINEEKFNEMKRFELKSGDLIMSCSGTMGKIAIVPDGIKQGIINQALLKLTPGEKVNSRFLKLWMQSENFQNSLQEYSQGAAIQNVASVAILKQIQIPLPDLVTQTQIVSQLDELSQVLASLKSAYQSQLQHFDQLRASTLDQAFKGELVK